MKTAKLNYLSYDSLDNRNVLSGLVRDIRTPHNAVSN